MGNSVTCGVCGTVNVGGSRCIACGQALAAPDAPMDPTLPLDPAAVAPSSDATIPLDRQKPPPAAPRPPAPPAPQPATEPMRPGTATAEVAASAARRTILEPSVPPAVPPGESGHELVVDGGPAAPSSPAESQARLREERFVVRLLLPEGDKQLAEVGSKPVRLGSGLDELGLAGDPRVGSGEATLRVTEGRLWIETTPDATGIYRRIDSEEPLQDGDVVLMGDVAAEFRTLDPVPAPQGERHVLGGTSPSAAGRLIFLRRDGSPGPVHDLPLGRTIVGRTDGHVNFPQDSRLSRRHVRFHASETEVTVEDLDSRNGTYVRLRGRRALAVGEALRVGSAGIQIRGRS